MKRTLDERIERVELLMRVRAHSLASLTLDPMTPGWLNRRRARQWLRLERVRDELLEAREAEFRGWLERERRKRVGIAEVAA